MKLNLLLLLATLAICCTLTCVQSEESSAAAAAADDGENKIETPATQQPTSARARFQLPKLFDFGRFKALFKKSYRSLVEELARQKIFLARAFRAFVSAVSYKHGKSSSYLSVNQMSDWTPEDVERSKLSLDKLSDSEAIKNVKPVLYSEEDDFEQHLADDSLPAANLNDIEEALEEVERHKSEPGYREIAEELGSVVRSKRNVETRGMRKHRISTDNLMRSPEAQEPEEVKEKVLRRVPSNNPSREQPEFVSFGSDEPDQTSAPMDGYMAKMINKIPGASYLSSVLQSAQNMFLSATDNQPADKIKEVSVFYDAEPMDIDEAKDEVFVDHRTSNCFFTPRNQGSCGSCYAFATIAMFEYLYCKANGNLVAFSEQYLVDCGDRTGMEGCDGARLSESVKFVNTYGVELRTDYPYRMTHDQCPYEAHAKPEQMGYIKLAKTGLGHVKLDEFDKYLEYRPIMYGLLLGPEFRHYGGGVHENPGCSRDDAHAMLIVGHGREDGKEYYLIRNSHSISWGEAGYYKISKQALIRCRGDSVGSMALGRFSKREQSNPSYVGQSKIKRRYKDYLLNNEEAVKRQRQ